MPGEVIVGDGDVELFDDATTIAVEVANTGDRPIQVGSHFHLPDTNPALEFDRAAADGLRLDIPAGTSVRFEPGVSREVGAVTLQGARRVPGLQLREDER